MREDFRYAAGVAWLVVSVIVLLVLAAPLVLDHSDIGRWSPVCEAKLRGGPGCSLCGMTTAFLAISMGRFDQALAENRASVALYLAFVLNELLVLLFICSLFKGGRLWRC